MRNPERIDVFCNKLAKIWKEKCPDWRFSQFIMNIFGTLEQDPWAWEEDKMMQYIENYFNKEK